MVISEFEDKVMDTLATYHNLHYSNNHSTLNSHLSGEACDEICDSKEGICSRKRHSYPNNG
jgi:hypothetical protein